MQQEEPRTSSEVIDPEEIPDRLQALPETYYPPQLNVVSELLDWHIRAGNGDRPAILFQDQEITYATLQKRVNQFGNSLLSLGVTPGDRVLLRVLNRPEAVIASLAAQKIGAIPVPSMKLLRANELEHVLGDADPTLAVVHADVMNELRVALANYGRDVPVVLIDGRDTNHGHHEYQDLLAEGDSDLEAYQSRADEKAILFYTSGTTGRPKGAFHTHQELLSTADTYAKHCLNPSSDDVFGGNPPLPFSYGYGAFITIPLRFGATSSLIANSNPRKVLDRIESHEISVLFSVPTGYNQMLSEYKRGERSGDFSSLRLGVSAGEPLPPHTYRRFKDVFEVELLDGIGTTEMGYIFISHRHSDDVDPTVTGYPVPGYECRILDPKTGEELGPGEPGVLAVRGPTRITYWNLPEKQAEMTEGDWNLPGDVFVQHEDGRLEYKARRDDIIISSGYKIAPFEVEKALEELDAVDEAAVVGIPDNERGQIVKAYIKLTDGYEGTPGLTAEIQDEVKQDLAPYKYPREIEYLEEFPRTETGKVRRQELTENE